MAAIAAAQPMPILAPAPPDSVVGNGVEDSEEWVDVVSGAPGVAMVELSLVVSAALAKVELEESSQ